MERKVDGTFRRYALSAVLTVAVIAFLYPEKTAHETNRPSITDEPPAEQTGSVNVRPILPPPLKRICSCESTGRPDREPQHFEADGVTVRTGRVNPLDTGMCQINLHYWGDAARELGFDLFNEEDNVRMALWIYERHGTQPWDWSSHCWNN